jgi:hypothetical protein
VTLAHLVGKRTVVWGTASAEQQLPGGVLRATYAEPAPLPPSYAGGAIHLTAGSTASTAPLAATPTTVWDPYDPGCGLPGAAPLAYPYAPGAAPSAWPAIPVGCGIVGGGELLFLRPYFQGTGEIVDPMLGLALRPDFDFELSPRAWIGFVTDQGLGFRTRYWEFDHASSRGTAQISDPEVEATATADRGLEARTIDLEATQQAAFQRWMFVLAGGLRYAEYNEDERLRLQGTDLLTATPFDLTTSSDAGFDGIGPTFGVQAERALANTNFSIYSGLRGSLLFGRRKAGIALRDNMADTVLFGESTRGNDLIAIWEVNLGLQYLWPLSGGGNVFVRGGVEGQYWQGPRTIDPFFAAVPGDMGFGGFTVAAGVNR